MRESRVWSLNLIAALVILAFLGLHMVIMHLDGTLALLRLAPADPLGWEQVLARAKSAFFTSSYILLLAAALFHGFYGLRTMISEFSESAVLHAWTTGVLWVAGLALQGIGSYALVVMHLRTVPA